MVLAGTHTDGTHTDTIHTDGTHTDTTHALARRFVQEVVVESRYGPLLGALPSWPPPSQRLHCAHHVTPVGALGFRVRVRVGAQVS